MYKRQASRAGAGAPAFLVLPSVQAAAVHDGLGITVAAQHHLSLIHICDVKVTAKEDTAQVEEVLQDITSDADLQKVRKSR